MENRRMRLMHQHNLVQQLIPTVIRKMAFTQSRYQHKREPIG